MVVVHHTCTKHRPSTGAEVWNGHERARMETITATAFPLLAEKIRWCDWVVRDRIELSIFRFSGGFAGPRMSTVAYLSRRYALLAAHGVHARRRVSTTVR
jgi:hypothetical protein